MSNPIDNPEDFPKYFPDKWLESYPIILIPAGTKLTLNDLNSPGRIITYHGKPPMYVEFDKKDTN